MKYLWRIQDCSVIAHILLAPKSYQCSPPNIFPSCQPFLNILPLTALVGALVICHLHFGSVFPQTRASRFAHQIHSPTLQ